MASSQEIFDTLIIGAGPAGLSAAIHLGFQRRKVVVVDRRSSPMYFYTNPVNNYPGVQPNCSGVQILKKIRGEASDFGIPIQSGNVISVQGKCPDFEVEVLPKRRTAPPMMLKAKTLVFATGTARMHPCVKGDWRRWLRYAGKRNISFYCPECESPLTIGKDILVVNTGTVNSALYIARRVQPFARRVRIFMTEDSYMPFKEEDRSILDESGFEWMSGLIDRIEADTPGEGQRLITTTGEVFECNHFFVAWVAIPRSEVAVKMGVKVDQKGNIITDHRGKTNVEGVWAAGDIRPITQSVAMAVGTGNYAGVMIDHFLRKLEQ
jgi:thioredoxin reductase (NADPH)